MARKVETTLVDDITGEPAAETIEFSVAGVAYEFDASPNTAMEFREALAGYVESARPAGKTAPRSRSAESYAEKQAQKEQSTKIREWAVQHGIPVAERGRVSQKVRDAYRAGRPELATAGA